MKFNYDVLRGRIANQSSVPKLARAIGITPTTMRRRLAGDPFRTDEIIKLAKILHIDISDFDIMKTYFLTIPSSQK